jgi:membrane protease YdiL (CAAX protease family)
MTDEPSDVPEPEVPSEERQRQTIVLTAVLLELGLAVLATVLGWLLGKPPLQQFSWGSDGALWGVAAAVPMVVVFFVLHTWPVGPLRRIRRFGEEVIRPLFAPCTVVDLLGISVLAGIGEEMLFRGLLQVGCAQWFGSLPLAILVGAVLFGVVHAITLTYALLAALAGAYLGIVFAATGNLLSAIVAHTVYDFVALLWLLRGPGSQALPPETRSEEPEEASARHE